MGRSPCCDKHGFKKGPWSPEEDMKLTHYIQMHGPGNWRSLPKNAGLERCGKSCRLRWINYLRPDIKRGRFSFEEEETIIQLHSVLGNKWSTIAAKLPGRTDNEIKNYWNTHIRKRFLRMRIDPVTHAPRLDPLDLSSSVLNSSDLVNLSNLLRLQTLLKPEALRLAANILASNYETPQLLLQKLHENQLLNAQMQNQTPTFQSNQLGNAFDKQILPCNQSNLPYSSLDQTDLMQSVQESFHSASEQIGTDLLENLSFNSVPSTPLSSPAPLNSASSTYIHGSTEDENCSDFLKFEIPEGLDIDDFM
ncbi:unnamed protein product [Fraxinus pennsylvanica]|uniref:Myb-like domain-containing protein n=1 Tax=Fraxinus pennsylvanica TaxID=56036 RepID=A0AAD1YWZ9_9LAMI|nr:unnamed protein product [Fraxinus pennsylvanica]